MTDCAACGTPLSIHDGTVVETDGGLERRCWDCAPERPTREVRADG